MVNLQILIISLVALFLRTSSINPLNIIILSDTSYSASDPTDYIDKELVPVLKTITINYILLTGGLTSTGNKSDLSSLIGKLIPFGTVYWIPGAGDPNPTNFTHSDFNLHNTFVNPVPNLYFAGLGGSTYDLTVLDALYASTNVGSTPSSLVFLTHDGPFGFDTAIARSAAPFLPALTQAQWNDTGSQNVSDFISSVQNIIVHAHGNNPQGIGASRLGQVQIINPGSAKSTRSFAWLELVADSPSGYFVNSWKFYQYGDVPTWGGQTNVTACKVSSPTVPSPYTPSAYSSAAIAMFTLFLASIVVGFGIFVATGPVT